LRAELLTALQTISEGMTLLRDRGDQYGRTLEYDLPQRTQVARQTEERPRFGKGRTHKASSAESILRHVLRQRGWTKLYHQNGLTGKQHLNLLEDVRAYSRMYLRHEAESFFDRYGVEVDERDSGPTGARSILGGDQAISARFSGQALDSIDGNAVARGIASRAAGALSRLFDRAKGFVREVIVAGAMALKGNDPLTNAEIFALDKLTRKQYDYLDKFQREVTANPPREIVDLSSGVIFIEPPPLTPGQFIARMEMYGNSPWEVQNVGREIVRGQHVFSAERRVHLLSIEQHRPCKGGIQGCLEQSQLGWQPIGTLIEIGDCYCMNNCDCYFEWQDPKGKIYVSPWGRHNPKGFNVEGDRLPGIEFPSQPSIPVLPSGPGPSEKRKKIKLKPVPKVSEPYPKGGEYPPARPLPSVEELLQEAGSPFPASEYEEA